MKKKTIITTISVAVAVILLVAVLSVRQKTFTKTDILMDTAVSQIIYAPEKNAQEAISAATETIREFDLLFNSYNNASEISRINNSAGVVATADQRVVNLISKAKEYSKNSDGTFDLSVLPLSRLWTEAIKTGVLPPDEQIKAASENVDFGRVIVDTYSNTVKIDKNMGLDLSAIVKGAVLNLVDEQYEKYGVENAICSLGQSSMLVKGGKKGKEFKIGLRDPMDSENGIFATLLVSDAIISTSGAYERYADIDGRRYHHIVDLQTGYPVESDVLSATVISADGALSDYMSTRLFIEGTEKALQTVKSEKLDAIIVSKDKKVFVSAGLLNKLEIENKEYERVEIK